MVSTAPVTQDTVGVELPAKVRFTCSHLKHPFWPLNFTLEIIYYCSVDINECDMNLDECSLYAGCSDNVGSYDCSCNSGFEGDGFICESEYIFWHEMDSQLLYSTLNTPDIDECAVRVDNCSEYATCSDTLGSYNCTCSPGFSGDGFNCMGELALYITKQKQ